MVVEFRVTDCVFRGRRSHKISLFYNEGHKGHTESGFCISIFGAFGLGVGGVNLAGIGGVGKGGFGTRGGAGGAKTGRGNGSHEDTKALRKIRKISAFWDN